MEVISCNRESFPPRKFCHIRYLNEGRLNCIKSHFLHLFVFLGMVLLQLITIMILLRASLVKGSLFTYFKSNYVIFMFLFLFPCISWWLWLSYINKMLVCIKRIKYLTSPDMMPQGDVTFYRVHNEITKCLFVFWGCRKY